MPRISQTKINNVFSFSTGSWLNWSDEAPAPQQQPEQEPETEQNLKKASPLTRIILHISGATGTQQLTN